MLRVSGKVVVRCKGKSLGSSRNGLVELRFPRLLCSSAGVRGLGKEPVGEGTAGDTARFLNGLLDERLMAGDA